MSNQTTEYLIEKTNKWVDKNIITKQQQNSIIVYSERYGFWEALGYATRLKYRNNHSKKKYDYKMIQLKPEECLLQQYKTSGFFSDKKRKRIRRWRNIYFDQNGNHREFNYPEWEIYKIDRNKLRVFLRKEKDLR